MVEEREPVGYPVAELVDRFAGELVATGLPLRHGGRTGWAPGHDLDWDD